MKAFICILLAVLLLGCASQQPPSQQPNQQPNQTHTVSLIRTPKGGELTVHISGFSFNPSDITVSAGTKVTWINDDPVAHTVTFDDGTFDAGQFPHGDSRSYTFTTPGKYTYHCTIHPSMKGSVTVT